MRRFIGLCLVLWCLFCVGWPTLAQTLLGFPPGMFDGRAVLDAASGGGTVLFDAVASAFVVDSGTTTTLSWTHTPVGTPTKAAVAFENYDTNCTVSGVTYGGVSMVQEASQTISAGGSSVQIWALANPSAGAQTVVITCGQHMYTQAGSITVTGGSTVTAIRAANTALATSTTPSVSVTSATGDFIVDVVGSTGANVTTTAGGSQNKRWGPTDAGTNTASSSTLPAGSGSTTMTWTLGSSVTWGQAAVSLHN